MYYLITLLLSSFLFVTNAYSDLPKSDKSGCKTISKENLTEGRFFIKSPLNFSSNCVVTGYINRDTIRELFFEELDGRGQLKDGLIAVDGHKVKNCNDYFQHEIDDSITSNKSFKSFFVFTCEPLKKLLYGAKPKTSFLKENLIDNIKLTTVSILPSLREDDEIKEGLTVEDLINNKKAKIEQIDDRLRIEYNGILQYIDEIARADFNGDGAEDIFLNIAEIGVSSSYRNYTNKIISRHSEQEILNIIKF